MCSRAHRPGTRFATRFAVPPLPVQRQRIAGRPLPSPRSKTAASRSLFGVFELGIERIDVDRQMPLFGQVIPGVFVGRAPSSSAVDFKVRGDASHELLGMLGRVAVVVCPSSRDQLSILARPARRPAPIAAQRPRGQRLRRDTICPGRNAAAHRGEVAPAAARTNVSGRRRLLGPTAAMFHSGPSMSSIETNVGSPPIVRRTSPAASRASTSCPSASIAPIALRCTAW